jgi:transposase
MTRTFGTMTQDLLELADWLGAAGCTHVAMESTGVYWKPVYNVLEGQFELLVVNAQHLRAVPGRKTDTSDAEWIADLLQHGLLRGSFVPPAPQRELRELTRYRGSLIRERTRTINRLQKVLEVANIKLASVTSDIVGVSARAMLQALLQGQTDPIALADLARGRLRHKREALQQALTGLLKPHHRFMIASHLEHIDYLDQAIEQVDVEIQERVRPFDSEVALLDSIPGIGQRSAQVLLAEVGADMARFPSHQHLASWAGMCPGSHESAGKRKSGKTRKGSPWLRATLVEAAHAAAHTKDTYLASQYQRLASRRGAKRALVAVGHSILVAAYYILSRKTPYSDLGPNYCDQRRKQATEKRLVQRLENLGYRVALTPSAAPA